MIPDLIEMEQELFELPQKVSQGCMRWTISLRYPSQERVVYNKEIQTMAFDDDETAGPSEEDIRQRVVRERETAETERASREKELEEESVQLDKEIEEEIRGQWT